MIGFANDTNWVTFTHLRLLEVKIDMFLNMKDGPKEPQRAIFIKDLQMEIRDNFTGLTNRIGLQVGLICQSEPVFEMCLGTLAIRSASASHLCWTRVQFA